MYKEAPIKNGMFDFVEFTRWVSHITCNSGVFKHPACIFRIVLRFEELISLWYTNISTSKWRNGMWQFNFKDVLLLVT